MLDENKTKKELIAELKTLRQHLSESDKNNMQESNDSSVEKIMNGSPSAIVIHRDGVILYINPVCMRLMKVDKLEQVLGKSVFDFLHPDFHKIAEEHFEKARKGTLDNKAVEEKYICTDGSIIDVEVIGASIIYRGQPAMRSIFFDITERKETERALQKSEELYRNLIKFSPLGIIIINEKGDFLRMNEKGEEITGYSLDELPDFQTWFIKLYPDDEYRKDVLKVHNTIDQDKSPRDKTVYITTKTGQKRQIRLLSDYLADGTRIVFLEDITERIQKDETIRQLSRVVEQSASIVVITDTQGNIEFVNPAFTEITGYTEEEALGQNPRILKSGHTPPHIYKEMWETICQGKTWRGELLNKKKNRELFWESATISSITDENGEISHFVAMKENITKRKAAELALRQSEEKYRLLFDNSPDAIIIRNTEKILYTNIAAEKLFHANTREDLIGTDCSDMLGGETTQLSPKILMEMFETKKSISTWERTFYRPDGTFFIGEVGATPFIYEGEPAIQAIVRDVTEQRRMEEALEKSEERFRSIVETAPLGIVTIDTKGNIIDANTAILKLLGSPSLKTTQAINVLTFPLFIKAGISERIQRCLDTGDIIFVEKEYTSKWGKTADWRMSIAPIHNKTGDLILAQMIVEDITERKKNESDLNESKEKFRNLVEQSEDGIALIDQSGIILEWNQGMTNITGFSRDSVLGTLLWESQYQLATDERKSPELAKRIEIGIRTLLENKELLLSKKMEERPIQRSDGRIRNMQSILYPITTKNGFMMGMISRDVTKRKEAEAEIAKRTAQLESLSKIGIEIISQRDCQKILNTIMKETLRLVDGVGGGIYLYNKEKKTLEWAIGINAMVSEGDILQRGEGMGGAVWESGKTISVSDYSNWEKRSKGVCSTLSHSPMIGTPICWAKDFLGVLIIRGKRGNVFTEDDTKLLETLSTQAALAIRNAHLFNAERQAHKKTQTLQAATQAINSSLALPDVLTAIISELQKVLPYDSCSVLQMDKEHIEIIAGTGFVNTEEIIGLRFPINNEEDNPSSTVINTRQSFIVDDVSIYPSFQQEDTIKNQIASWLGVPMLFEGKIVGIIAIDKKEKAFFNDHHKKIAEAFAAQASLALKKAELFTEANKLAQAVNFSGSSVLITDLDGKIEFVNDAFSTMSGYSAEEIIGKGTSILKSGKTEIKTYEELWGKITQGNIWRGELLNRKKNGELYWDAMVISPIIDKDNNITHYVAVKDEITERKEEENRLAHQATHDILTNLPNRAFFNERIKHALALAKRNSWQIALLFIDLNDFKAINDTFGHNVGDDTLIEFGKRLQISVRDSDTVVRLGGDEFACLLEKIPSKKELALLAEKIIANIKMPFNVNEEKKIKRFIEKYKYKSTKDIVKEVYEHAGIEE